MKKSLLSLPFSVEACRAAFVGIAFCVSLNRRLAAGSES